ncbi:hypothetical protein ACP4OV_006728 [Aristida adscensionis]
MASGGATLKMATAFMLVLLLGQVLIMANAEVSENLFDQVAFWNDVQTIQRGNDMAAVTEARTACIKKCADDAQRKVDQSDFMGRGAAAEAAYKENVRCVSQC